MQPCQKWHPKEGTKFTALVTVSRAVGATRCWMSQLLSGVQIFGRFVGKNLAVNVVVEKSGASSGGGP